MNLLLILECGYSLINIYELTVINVRYLLLFPGVHQVLKDTIDSQCYFRLSPFLSENYDLSEINPAKIQQMLDETNIYIDKNEVFVQRVVDRLKQERLPNQKMFDFAARRKHTHNYMFF